MNEVNENRRKKFLQLAKEGEPMDELYDKWARDYDEDNNYFYSPTHDGIYDVVDRIFKGNQEINILDFGSGTGCSGKKLAERGYVHMDAVDASKEMLKISEDLGIYKKTYCHFVGLTPLPIEDGTYDCVIAVGVICPKHLGADAIPELCRLMKKGGYFIVQGNYTVWNELSEFYVDMAAMLQKMVDENKLAQVTWALIDGYMIVNGNEQKGLLFVYKKL